jgi:hypothetical protein
MRAPQFYFCVTFEIFSGLLQVLKYVSGSTTENLGGSFSGFDSDHMAEATISEKEHFKAF